jgi:hypothetical protein
MEGLAELRAFLEVFLGEDSWITERPPAAPELEVDVTGPDGVRPEEPVAP